MIRKSFLSCWTLILLSFPVYSQSDSVPTDLSDTTLKENPSGMTDSVIPIPATTQTVVKKKAPVYKMNTAVDISIITTGTLWAGYAFTKIYDKTPPTAAQVNNLNTENINAFDRWAVYPYSQSLDDISYIPFYAAIPYPLLIILTGKETRSDFLKLTLLYWEAMSVTALTGITATYYVDRYRPYSYSPETSMEKRTGSIALNSFYAGHVQMVATPTFFAAKVYADYHPDSKIKWVFYGIASVATGATAYMRVRGGMHFPTDVLMGTLTGVLSGILVPQSHKIKSSKIGTLGFLPFKSGDLNGLTCTYHFRK